MFLLLITIFILHITTIVLLFVATIDSAWWVNAGKTATDLWQHCVAGTADSWRCSVPPESQSQWLQAVQGLLVLGVVFCCVSLFLFVYQLYRLEKGGRFLVTAAFHFLAGLSALLGGALYAGQRPRATGGPYAEGAYGHSFIAAWAAVALSAVSTGVYAFLRKRS